MAQNLGQTFAAFGTDATCACAADTAEIEVIGMGAFSGNFQGEMAVRTGRETLKNGLATLPLEITKHSTEGTAPGIGKIKVYHDSDRPLPPSQIQELAAGTGFPACQEMYVNIKITLDALPEVVLRNVNTGVLKCDSQNAFPPQNATYVLQEPMDLEDRANPGKVVARRVSYKALINP